MKTIIKKLNRRNTNIITNTPTLNKDIIANTSLNRPTNTSLNRPASTSRITSIPDKTITDKTRRTNANTSHNTSIPTNTSHNTSIPDQTGGTITDRQQSVGPNILRRRNNNSPSSYPVRPAEPDILDDDLSEIADMCTGHNRKGKIKASKIIEELRRADGMVSVAAKNLNVTYRTLVRYIRNNKQILLEIQAIEEEIIDKVESKLFTMIGDGHPAAVFFFLKCKAKRRGYIESVTHAPPPTQPITFKYQLVLPPGYENKRLIEDKTIDITTA